MHILPLISYCCSENVMWFGKAFSPSVYQERAGFLVPRNLIHHFHLPSDVFIRHTKCASITENLDDSNAVLYDCPVHQRLCALPDGTMALIWSFNYAQASILLTFCF